MHSEMFRQMKSGQMHRFVSSLPGFAVDTQMPDRFASLLAQMDQANDGEVTVRRLVGIRRS